MTKTDQSFSVEVKMAAVSIIKQMMYLAQQEIKKGKEIVSLSVGIPYYSMPRYIKRQIRKILSEDPEVDKYSFFMGLEKLRKAIAEKIKADFKINTSEEEILITPGSMAALIYTFTTLLNKGDEVILFSPYFSSHAEQIIISGGVPVEVPLIAPKEKDGSYTVDFDFLEKN